MARVAVIGLGKLGAPLLGVLASAGHTVIGSDIDVATVDAIRERRAPVPEPGLQELLSQRRIAVEATTEIHKAVRDSEVSFVVLPTPSRADGTFSADGVVEAVTRIGAGLRNRSAYHLIVVVSTVMPGTTGGLIRRALEGAAGRALGDALGLCYNPSFVALGNVVAGFRRPDLVLIGESDARAGTVLERIHRSICDGDPEVRRMSPVNAELTKIAINSYVTAKISFANMLSELCERMPGADAAIVTDAMGCDPRIGRSYFRPALGYGGPCFPRDNVAMSAFALSLGLRADMAVAADSVNRRQIDRLLALVRGRLGAGTVAVLGLSYKPGTPNCDESQGMAIAAALAAAGYHVLVSDPEALDTAMGILGDRVEAVREPADALRAADLAIVATPWPAYGALPASAFRRDGNRLTVVDCWGLPSLTAHAADIELIHLGRSEPSLV